MRWYLESALGYESGSICICHIYPYLLGEKMFNITWLTFWKQLWCQRYFFYHILDVFPFKIQWFRLFYIYVTGGFFAVFFNQDGCVHQVNLGKSPGAMTSPPAATAAPHRGSSAVNWLPWLLASRRNGSIEGDRWNWVGGWNSLAGGEVTALIFWLIFFCWLFNFWRTYPRILPWKGNMFPENQWLEDVFPIELMPLV